MPATHDTLLVNTTRKSCKGMWCKLWLMWRKPRLGSSADMYEKTLTADTTLC